MKPRRLMLFVIGLLFITAVLPVAAGHRPTGETTYQGGSVLTLELSSEQPATLAAPAGLTNADKVAYLTFDDGPGPWTAHILDVLGRYNARATFFAIGRQVPAYSGIVNDAARAGSTFGNHTFNHPSLAGISHPAFRREIQATEDVLRPYVTRCLRPPYGAMDANTRAYAQETGYRIVMWDIDPRDWARPGAGSIATHVLERMRPGAIVLLHDGGGNRAQTVAALEMILRALSAQGYRFEPICR